MRGSRYTNIAAEAIWVGFGQVAAAAGGFIGLRLLTTRLDPSVYGELALGLTIGLLMQQLLYGPTASAGQRMLSLGGQGSKGRVLIEALSHVLKRPTLIVGAAGLALGVIAAFGKGPLDLGALAVSLFLSILMGLSTVIENILTAARLRKRVAIYQGLAQWLRPALAVLAITFLGRTSVMALLGMLISALVVLVSEYRFVQHLFGKEAVFARATESENLRSQIAGYARPLMIWGAFTAAQMASDRWALQLYRTSSDVGMYQALYQVGNQPVTFAGSALLQLATPIIFAKAGSSGDRFHLSKAHRLTNQLTVATLIGTMLLTAATYVSHSYIFALCCGVKYRQASQLLPVVVCGAGLFTAAQVLATQLLTEMQTVRLLPAKVSIGIGGVVLNLIMVKTGGLCGVVWAGLMSSLAFLVWTYWLVRARRPARVHTDPQLDVLAASHE